MLQQRRIQELKCQGQFEINAQHTIKHATAKLDWPFHPISSKCEFHSRKEKVDILYFSHFGDISFPFHMTEADTVECRNFNFEESFEKISIDFERSFQ